MRLRRGRIVRIMLNWRSLGVLALVGCGIAAVGCKSAPDLTPAQALALVQAKYDQTPPVATTILVNEVGVRQLVIAKLWERTKVYPNKLWADFKLTPDGKKSRNSSRRRRRDRVASGESG